jgi:hypothetical protein
MMTKSSLGEVGQLLGRDLGIDAVPMACSWFSDRLIGIA